MKLWGIRLESEFSVPCIFFSVSENAIPLVYHHFSSFRLIHFRRFMKAGSIFFLILYYQRNSGQHFWNKCFLSALSLSKPFGMKVMLQISERMKSLPSIALLSFSPSDLHHIFSNMAQFLCSTLSRRMSDKFWSVFFFFFKFRSNFYRNFSTYYLGCQGTFLRSEVAACK